MPPSCVNGGGAGSILRLAAVPVCEQEIGLGRENLPVLKLWSARPGEILTAIDPERGCYRVRLTELGENPLGVPFARLSRQIESRLSIEVYQALPEKERFELILQKLTELGAARIVPLETSRSISRSERDATQAKSHRWPDIVLRAAKQCRRAMLPELFKAASFSDTMQLAAGAELKLMLYEGEETWSLSEALGRLRPENVALLVGPEGGFTGIEVAEARAAGFLPVSLGPRILRTETASIAGVTLLQGLLGDLG
ncbi:MAG: RsmE family RNA methyltransferase [Desulfuromonadales bacterium]|nr:RsmE family RNA methyltransferase [Desulfuromonadales bacterium]